MSSTDGRQGGSAHRSHRKRTHIIKVSGQFVAKAMLDSRIIDLSFNKIFLKLILGEEVPLNIDTLQVCDRRWWSMSLFSSSIPRSASTLSSRALLRKSRIWLAPRARMRRYGFRPTCKKCRLTYYEASP